MKLDKYQRKVIKDKSRNLLVIAGAGSGKTFTITQKIKHLIKNGINPKDILCITFTKMATQNLEKRLLKENIILKVKTFHSLGYQIIKQNKNVNLVKEEKLKNIIKIYLNKYPNLYELIPTTFIEYGFGNSSKIKNAILKNTIYYDYLINTFKTFINLFKSNNYNLSTFNDFSTINKNKNNYRKQKRHQKFLSLAKKIYIHYEDYLRQMNQIDFNDMINLATKVVKKDTIYPYKYIIIDEYQDTSLNKCELIKAIQEKTKANLIAVGDDWQSIYQFTGSNLSIFTKFKTYFPKARIIKLKKTYRNCQELIKTTQKFINKNPYQIKKKIISNKSITSPIHIYYYKENIKEVWNKIPKLNGKTYILSRNNQDKNKIPYLKENMHFLTIHKSKGLEADNIIIINLENSIMGFPSKIENSEYLMYVTNSNETYPYAEERRLFYVALTRTKNEVYLLVNKDNPSIFINEILQNSSKYIKIHQK